MISVEAAKRLVMEHIPRLGAEEMGLYDARGGFISADIIAPVDHPLFDASAVDGYAFAFDASVSNWTIVATIQAGALLDARPGRGECVRIFTGAMLPDNTDTVVMQEFVSRMGDTISHSDPRLVAGSNVRRQGEHVRRGDVVLPAGSPLTPQSIGLLASVGVERLPVTRSPHVAVLITGDEFIQQGGPQHGRIFSSNDVMLEAAVRGAGAVAEVGHVADDRVVLEQALVNAARHGDVIISTGGASVGDHDLVSEAVLKVGGTIHFHGVAQKPGKPMLFATVHGKPFFGLPGNPRAVMILFWEYVLPFLRAMRGSREPGLRRSMLPIEHSIMVRGERSEFRAARVQNGSVRLLADEGSHMLRTLVEADAIAYLPAERRSWQVAEPIEVHHLPG